MDKWKPLAAIKYHEGSIIYKHCVNFKIEHWKISVCRIYSKISKDRLRRVGGLFLCLEIFDFDLSFLGWKHLAENIVNSVGVSALCYQAVLQTDKWLYHSAVFVIIKIDMELFFSHSRFLHSLNFALITETSASTSE